MATLDEVLQWLRERARPDELEGMARFGIDTGNRLGVSMPELRRLGRTLGRDHALAQALWDTGIPDAQILAGLVAEPARLGSRQMDAWARSLRSWDVCDGACLNAFVYSPLAWHKVAIWARRREEFVRRAAFALLAQLAVHDKASPDARFIEALALVEEAATDERNFVRKAVNWALRAIGKRNAVLHAEALRCARTLGASESRSARWIAADALRELQGEAVRGRWRADGASQRGRRGNIPA